MIFTVPLRQVMVAKSDLPYPEGVAAAEILKAGNHEEGKGDSGIKEIATGGVIAAVVSFATNGLRLIADGTSLWFKGGNAVFQVPMGFSLALLGAGYLVGIVGGIAILVGIFLTWGVAVPYFTSTSPMPMDADMVNYAMGIWKSKVRFIGVGTIGIAAIWTLLVLMKPMIQGMAQSFRALKDPSAQTNDRTQLDLYHNRRNRLDYGGTSPLHCASTDCHRICLIIRHCVYLFSCVYRLFRCRSLWLYGRACRIII
ncbi:hypothetical protein AVEN109717_08025 [Avibacterium endocarditidis]